MAKLTILAAALLALLALGQLASAARTTITTTVLEEGNPRGESCREQIQRQQQLRHCQMYLSSMMSPYEWNPQQQHMRQCCQQLENLDEQCRCGGLRAAMRQQEQEGEMMGEERQKMEQMAENLPSRCNLSPRRCQFRAAWF